ncbi:MAG: Flp family type IVb pilin [Thiolinea sp.]
MKKLKKYLTEIYQDEQGLTTVEYAIAGGLVGAVVVTSFTSLGTAIVAKIGEIISAVG